MYVGQCTLTRTWKKNGETYGVLLPGTRNGPYSPLDDRVVAPGFATKKVKTMYYDDNGRKKTFTWPFSMPFNVVDENSRPWTGQGF